AGEAAGESGRIADGDLLGIHLVGPDLEVSEVGFAVDRGKRSVHGVGTMGNFHATNTRDVVARVEGEPVLAEIHFTVGMEIHGRARIDMTDVRQVASHVAGGEIESAAQRDGHVGEVAADAVPAGDHFGGGEVGLSGTEPVFN